MSKMNPFIRVEEIYREHYAYLRNFLIGLTKSDEIADDIIQELIPVINDLEEEPRQILLEHIADCEECRGLYESTVNFNNSMPKQDYPEDVELKPLKKLVQFNIGLKLLLVTMRALILIYIFYTVFRFDGLSSGTLELLSSGVVLYYTPAAIFLLVFAITFFNRRWIWISLAIDLLIIFFLDDIVQLFL